MPVASRVALIITTWLVLVTGAVAADYPPEPSPAIGVNPFLGGYMALGGSYGVGSPRTFNVFSSSALFGFTDQLNGNGSPAGWSGIGAAGFNMTFGPALIGIELDGRWGDEKFSKDTTVANSNALGPAGSISYSYTFKNDAGVHLSGRLGAVFGDTLIFGKLGAGASRIQDKFGADQTGASRCTATTIVPGPNFTFTSVCVSPIAGGLGSFVQTRWVPSLIVGVGAERNAGPLFVRGAVEAETLAQDVLSFTQPTNLSWAFSGTVSSPNTQWIVRANALAGIRF